jgi:hypothetical protein
MDSDIENDEQIMQKVQMNMKKYHDVTIEAYEQSSLEEDESTPAKIKENHEAGSDGGPSPAHKAMKKIDLRIDINDGSEFNSQHDDVAS